MIDILSDYDIKFILIDNILNKQILLIYSLYSKQFKMMFYNSTESYNSTTDYNNSDICHATQKGVTTGVDSEYQFTDCFSIWLR